MSLRGSLETFALTEVLNLVAGTQKTGELQVVGDGATGSVWLDGGQIVGAQVADTTDPAEAVFRLLRLDAGEFSFESDATAPNPTDPVDVGAVLDAAQARLADWREIQQVVPSVQAFVTLVAVAPAEQVALDADQWAAVAAIGDGRSVEGLMGRLGHDELATGRRVKSLVEAGLAAVAAASPEPAPEPVRAATPKAATPTAAAAAARPDLVRQLASLNEATYTVTVADDAEHPGAADHEDEAQGADTVADRATTEADTPAEPGATPPTDESVNRGMLLKFLSSVRS